MYKLEFYLNTRLSKQIRQAKRAPGLLSDDEEAKYAEYAFERLQNEGGYIAKNCYSLTRERRRRSRPCSRRLGWRILARPRAIGLRPVRHKMYQNALEMKDYADAIVSENGPSTEPI